MRKIQVLHTHYLKSATVVLKEVLKVEPNHVAVDDRTIPYDYLVINTGSTYPTYAFWIFNSYDMQDINLLSRKAD